MTSYAHDSIRRRMDTAWQDAWDFGSFSLIYFFCSIELAKLPICTSTNIGGLFHFLRIAGAGWAKGSVMRPRNACTRACINFNIISPERICKDLGSQAYVFRVLFFLLIAYRAEYGVVLRDTIEMVGCVVQLDRCRVTFCRPRHESQPSGCWCCTPQPRAISASREMSTSVMQMRAPWHLQSHS